MQKSKFNEYSILRTIAMILVVFGHVQVFATANIEFVLPPSTLRNILDIIVKYIYFFHVPVLFFVSGAVYNIGCEKNKNYANFSSLIPNKAKRLLLPYALTFLLLLLPVRLLLNNYSSIKEVLLDFLNIGSSGHLWYLPTLFLCFLLFALAQKLLKKNILILGFILFAYALSIIIPDRYDTALRYLIWFGLGYFFNIIKQNLKIDKKYALPLWIISFILFLISGSITFSSSLLSLALSLICTLLGITQAVFLSIALSNSGLLEKSKLFAVLSQYSFDIYLYHDIFNLLILYIFGLIFDLPTISMPIYIILLLCKTFGVTILSVLFGLLIKKIKNLPLFKRSI